MAVAGELNGLPVRATTRWTSTGVAQDTQLEVEAAIAERHVGSWSAGALGHGPGPSGRVATMITAIHEFARVVSIDPEGVKAWMPAPQLDLEDVCRALQAMVQLVGALRVQRAYR